MGYDKLKTNLKLAIQRLKLLEKKKHENAIKSTKEIADLIATNKLDRARIKVEHIIREGFLVEAMEIIEMYCDLLLARFGIIESMKELDPGLDESVSSIFWATPRLESECPELTVVVNELQRKYTKEYALKCRTLEINNGPTKKVNEKLVQKLNEQAPSKLLVEKYLVEIAKSHRIPFTPDPSLTYQDYKYFYDSLESGNSSSQQQQDNNQLPKKSIPKDDDDHKKGGGFGGGGSGGAMAPPPPPQHPLFPSTQQVSHIDYNANRSQPQQPTRERPPSYHKENSSTASNDLINFAFPEVPKSLPSEYRGGRSNKGNDNDNDNDSETDDLARRFEQFKKK